MKQLFLALILFSFILSCKQTNSKSEEVPKPIEGQQEIAPDKPLEPIEDPAKVIPDVPLGFLVSYEGKYAKQENLFKNEIIVGRLKDLDRFNYDALLQNYHTETPIVIIDQIVHMSGCKQHSCPSNAYDFFIDLETDNINIYYFRNNMLRVYKEKDLIDLPSVFSSEMEIKKENAGIGDPNGIDSKYSLQ